MKVRTQGPATGGFRPDPERPIAGALSKVRGSLDVYVFVC